MWKKILLLILLTMIFGSGSFASQKKPGYPKTVTAIGTCLGTEEGDYVYVGIKVNGEDIWINCAEESVTKFFGSNPKGKEIALTYTVDMVYIEGAGEHIEWKMCKGGHVVSDNK